jgi:glycosyltransferase involved in cell wall biosynthesis
LKEVVLIISTDATRTGTPILLLNYLKWFKSNSELKFIVILQSGGELMNEYLEVCEVYIWPDFLPKMAKIKSQGRVLGIIFNARIFVKSIICRLFINKLKRKYRVRLIYSNTTRNGEILSQIKSALPSTIILHVHEGERTMDLFNKGGKVAYSISVSDLIITVSEAVKETIIRRFNPGKEILVIPGGIDTQYKFNPNIRELLKREGVSDGEKIVMCCGWLDWHKGTDLFMQVALQLSKENSNLHFVWVGGKNGSSEYNHLEFDIKKLNLADRVTIISSVTNPVDFINCADIFLILSREESFSLVTLEAGLAKKPVLCFDKSGGPVEIVNHDPRFLVPYADTRIICKRIQELLEDEEQSKQMGIFLYNRVLENYTIDKSGASVLQVITRELYKR